MPTVAINATVKGRAEIDGDGPIRVTLDIAAKNISGADITLTDPYKIDVESPNVKEVSAKLIGSKETPLQHVRASEKSQGIEVDLGSGTVLGKEQTLILHLVFEAKGKFEVVKETLFGPYAVNPMAIYQGMIVDHHFKYEFVFKSPKISWYERIWTFLKVNDVKQSNNGKAKPKLPWRWPWHTRLIYEFNSSIRFTFVRDYRFRSWLGGAFVFVAAEILDYALKNRIDGWIDAAWVYIKHLF